MGSKHSKQSKTGVASGTVRLLIVASGLVIVAAVGLLFAQQLRGEGARPIGPAAPAVAAPAPAPSAVPAAQPVPVQQDGRVVAVSATSVTAVGADGLERTYVVTPETATVTQAGDGFGAPVLPFRIDDEVSIIGEVRDGMPVATAVAARELSDGSGPPMDFALP